MVETDRAWGRLITSKEVMNRTGISRATLNNYIELGIIPSPVVKKPDDEAGTKARRIGYFPVSVLNRIDELQLYKEKGYTIKKIQEILIGAAMDHYNTMAATKRIDNQASSKFSHTRYSVTEELFPLERIREWPKRSEQTSKSGKASFEDRFKEGIPVPTVFSVLCAQLHDVSRISAEMLPEDFFRLMSQVWCCTNSVLGHYIGIHGRLIKNGILYYFIENDDSDCLMDAIIAAVELKESMKRMNRVFNEELHGDREFLLNIGLAEGRDYFGCIAVNPLKEYLAMGKASTEAGRLSDFGNNGSIWSTKSLITRLNKNDRMRVGYGIHTRQANAKQLLEKRFSRIEDLLGDDKERRLHFNDIRESIVTEILNIP